MTKTLLLIAAIIPATARADGAPTLADALRATRPTLDARLRHEHVDDDAFARDAGAPTLRTRVGLRSGTWRGFTAYVEAEDVRALDESYNSTANGRTRFPVVADPEGSEWNQAWVSWAHDPGTVVTAGRQRVLLDNQRFFGNGGFRQNEQTFDAVQAQATRGPVVARYVYVDEVHRVFGNEHPNPLQRQQELAAHLVNVAWTVPHGTLVGYGYFVDNEDLTPTSSRTLGARFAGAWPLSETWKALATVEYARQGDYAGGAATIDADYRLIEGGFARGATTAKLGIESLGGDGVNALQTPFATLHAFNGWADRFLTTPPDGLVDAYAIVAGTLRRGTWLVAYHDFDADRGGADYGREWNAMYRVPFATRYEVEVKLADYRSDGFATDVTKMWLALTVKL